MTDSGSDNLRKRIEDSRFKGCSIPPEGWWCSRERGHDGPCAARLIFEDLGFLWQDRAGVDDTPDHVRMRARCSFREDAPGQYDPEWGEEFDRWLEAVVERRVAAAKAEALEEFAQKLSGGYTLNLSTAGTLHTQIVGLLRRDAEIFRESLVFHG